MSVPFYQWVDHKLEEVAMSGLKAEINRSCTPEQAKAIRKVFEDQGWVEGIDFIDHTARGTLCYSKEEMDAFKEMLKKNIIPYLNLQRLRQRAEEIYVEEFSGGVAIENQTVLAEACARDMAKAYEQALKREMEAFREMMKEEMQRSNRECEKEKR